MASLLHWQPVISFVFLQPLLAFPAGQTIECWFEALPLWLRPSFCADSGIDPQWRGGGGVPLPWEELCFLPGCRRSSSALSDLCVTGLCCAVPPLPRLPPWRPCPWAVLISRHRQQTEGWLTATRCDSRSSSSVVAPFDGRRRWWTRTAPVCQRTDTLMFDGWDAEFGLWAWDPFSIWLWHFSPPTSIQRTTQIVVFPPGLDPCFRTHAVRIGDNHQENTLTLSGSRLCFLPLVHFCKSAHIIITNPVPTTWAVRL